MGEIKGVFGKIYVDPNAQPKFFKPRPVPYAMSTKVEAELDRLHKEGSIDPVKYSDWAIPIIPALKSSCKIRLLSNSKD